MTPWDGPSLPHHSPRLQVRTLVRLKERYGRRVTLLVGGPMDQAEEYPPRRRGGEESRGLGHGEELALARRAISCAASQAHSDLWRRVWDTVYDLDETRSEHHRVQ